MSAWMKTKSNLDDKVKKLTKDLKGATKQVALKVDRKLDHELSMLKLRNENKQLEIDLVREKLQDKLQTRKAPPTHQNQSQSSRPTHSSRKERF